MKEDPDVNLKQDEENLWRMGTVRIMVSVLQNGLRKVIPHHWDQIACKSQSRWLNQGLLILHLFALLSKFDMKGNWDWGQNVNTGV
jgi:hypothetical protein